MLGPIIIKQVVKLAKGTARFDAIANDIIAKFELGCPPKGELERIIQQKKYYHNSPFPSIRCY